MPNAWQVETIKYFTPELYLRFNSRDRSDVAKAHDDWEGATEAYRRHVQEIGPKMTESARDLAESLCLHDAEYLGMAVVPVSDLDRSLGVLLTRQNATRVFLIYLLVEPPLTQEVKPHWPFSKERVHWLYDEFEIDENGVQRHEVLLSNGRIITLRFHEMRVIKQDVEERVPVAQP